MFPKFFLILRPLVASSLVFLAACGSPTGSGDENRSNSGAVTGTAKFLANGGPPGHHVYMAAFFVHDAVNQGPCSNLIDLGMTANQPQAFSLTPNFPQNADANDFILFDVWIDLNDNGLFDGAETVVPLPTEPNDTVFLADDTLLSWQTDGWHFENNAGGIGDLYDVHMKDGAVLVSVSVN